MRSLSSAFVATIAAAAAAVPVAAPAQAPGWYGRYSYSEDLGRDAGGRGLAISVEHRLTIGRGTCRLSAEGYQRYEKLICRAVPAGRNGLRLLFVGPDRSDPQANPRPLRYAPGQPLLTLTRAGRRVLTRWQGYRVENPAPRPGVYFRRQG